MGKILLTGKHLHWYNGHWFNLALIHNSTIVMQSQVFVYPFNIKAI